MVPDAVSDTTVVCPSCGASFDVSKALHNRIEREVRSSLNTQLAGERNDLEAAREQLAADREALERSRETLDADVQNAVAKRLKLSEKELEKRIRAAVDEEKAEQYDAMQKELNQRSEEVKELHKTKAEIERLKREKEELRVQVQSEAEKQINESIRAEKAKIEERMGLKLSEKDTLIGQLREQLKDAQRKAEQGSVQLQGEVQELAIEEWLRSRFPADEVVEIKKGVRGGDCLHIVRSSTGVTHGSIYYESKRTKSFQAAWTGKLKDDMREKRADVGVIVTEAMPSGMERMEMMDGIWVCTFEEFKGLCAVLRDAVSRISEAAGAQENKHDKMSLLYDYLTGSEFRLQVEAIVEGFVEMQSELERERRAMEGVWKRRERQIEKVLLNTNHMYNSIKGIAGSAIASLPQLELPNDEMMESSS